MIEKIAVKIALVLIDKFLKWAGKWAVILLGQKKYNKRLDDAAKKAVETHDASDLEDLASSILR